MFCLNEKLQCNPIENNFLLWEKITTNSTSLKMFPNFPSSNFDGGWGKQKRAATFLKLILFHQTAPFGFPVSQLPKERFSRPNVSFRRFFWYCSIFVSGKLSIQHLGNFYF